MATPEIIIKWLDLLIEQTTYGNVPWRQHRSRDQYAFTAADGSSVYISSRDNDKMLPYVLAVATPDGDVTDRWIVYGDGVEQGDEEDAAPDWIASRARRLYGIVRKHFASDPIESMLAELDGMPPF